MRALTIVLLAALAGLWSYYAFAVAPGDTQPPRPVPVPHADRDEPNAADLNNTAIRLDREGHEADALAYLERAHAFRPGDETIAANLERQRHRVESAGWLRALLAGSLAGGLVVGGGALSRFLRAVSDGRHFAQLTQVGDAWIDVRPGQESADLAVRFNRTLRGLVRRHPVTVVWSSARYGKHMKSRPPVEARGRELALHLDAERIGRLARYPGEWKGFLYLGRRQVGEAVARVG
jgi:hypothetical protein